MTKRYNPHLYPKLKEARRKVRLAESNLRRMLREVQATCNHDKVLECPWHAGEWLGPFPAMRICLQCGLEEHTAWGQWPGYCTTAIGTRETSDNGTKLNVEFTKKVDSHGITRMRVR